MYKLHIANKNYSSWSLRPWVLMRALNIGFSEVIHPFSDSGNWDAFHQFSPTANVPCLVDGEQIVWDSLAITEYLADYLIYLDYHKHDVIWTRVFILRKSRSVPLKPQILKLNIERNGLSVEEIPIALKPVWFASKL